MVLVSRRRTYVAQPASSASRVACVAPRVRYLLSMRDQSLPIRRAALDDAAADCRETQQDGHPEQIALVALIGEALTDPRGLGGVRRVLSVPSVASMTASTSRSYNPRAAASAPERPRQTCDDGIVRFRTSRLWAH